MTERERKTAYAWDHIKQAGSAFAKRGDALLPGYRELKKMGAVTINGSHIRLAGDYRRAFLAGEDLPSWSDLSAAAPTARHHATKKSPAQLDREISEVLTPKRAHATVKTDDTASSTAELPLKEKLQQAAKWIRREIKKRDDGSHPSHLAAKLLEEADEKFKLGSYGVEGWAKSPSRGYQYLNYGDSYDPTIVVRSNPTQATVFVALGGWASYAGNA